MTAAAEEAPAAAEHPAAKGSAPDQCKECNNGGVLGGLETGFEHLKDAGARRLPLRLGLAGRTPAPYPPSAAPPPTPGCAPRRSQSGIFTASFVTPPFWARTPGTSA